MPDPDRPSTTEAAATRGTRVSATGPGYRRAVPPELDDEARQRLRWLLHDPEHWVLRTNWERYLRSGDEQLLITTDRLTLDQKVAAAAWLVQQRHALHRALEGGTRAPDGWIDALPMMQALRADQIPSHERPGAPQQPAGPAIAN